MGMDWLSRYKAKIICHEKIARIPLSNDKVLMVHVDRPEGDSKHLMSANMEEKKLEDILVVRDFPDVFPEDLSGVPPIR